VWIIVAMIENTPMRLAMKFGVSLARITPLPSVVVRKGLERVEHRGVGRRSGDQLDQMHVARGIEEVHAAEPRSQRCGQRVGQRGQREPGRIGRQNRIRRHVRRDLRVQVALPVDAFGDRLDHEVAVGEQRKVAAVVCRRDRRRQVLRAQWRGLELREAGNAFADDAVRVAVLCRQVEQNDRHIRIDQVRGDLRAHDAGAENRHLAHLQR
jgi:hypothetical protein